MLTVKPRTGVGFYVPMFHITLFLGIFHLQQIFDDICLGDVKPTPAGDCHFGAVKLVTREISSVPANSWD